MRTKWSLISVSLACGVVAVGSASAQLNIVNDRPGTFIDISGTGTNLGSSCDDCTVAFDTTHGNLILPAGTVFVSSNGTLCVPALAAFGNAALTAASTAGYYPFWDDQRTDLNGGDIYAENRDDRTIIQWNAIQLFGAPGTDFGTYQVQIFSSGPILAQFIYQDVTWTDLAGHSNGASATIGAVAADHTNFYQWSFNAASIADGTVLSVLPPTALRVDCNAADPGSVLPGGSMVLSARVTPAIPPSAITSVTVDLTSVGGNAAVVMRDNGVAPDTTAGDGTYTASASVSNGTTPGAATLPVTARDAAGSTATCNVAFTVLDPNAWDEQGNGGGDAGQTPATAQACSGTGPMTAITGTVAASGDADVYLIQICDHANFSATTIDPATVLADTQLFVFDGASGVGVTSDDDDPQGTGGLRSRLGATNITGDGAYYLAVTGYNTDPVDASGALLWANTPFNVERTPDGPGAANAWADFTGASGAAAYKIALTGVCRASARCVADVDDGTGTGTPDGGVTIDDLLYYLVIYSDGNIAADVDNGTFTGTHDGGVTIDDLLYFLVRYSDGC